MSQLKDEEECWKALVNAVKAFMSDYTSSKLPDEVKNNEKTFQACLRHEFIQVGRKDVRLEGSFELENGEKCIPDMILGDGIIICELKSNFKIELMISDLKQIEEYGKKAIGVFISSGSKYLGKAHYRDYENSIERLGYTKEDNTEILALKKGRHYYCWEYETIYYEKYPEPDRRLYMVINASKLK